MKKKMTLTPLSVLVDEAWGPIGTPKRDAMEAQLKEELQAYHIGETIKAERLRQNLTQEELGEKIGVKKSQISKLESGKCVITLPTMSRVFKALECRPLSNEKHYPHYKLLLPQRKQRSASVKNRNVVFARCGEGFGANKKLVACFLKLVARISKSEPLIFAPSQTRMNKGLGGIC